MAVDQREPRCATQDFRFEAKLHPLHRIGARCLPCRVRVGRKFLAGVGGEVVLEEYRECPEVQSHGELLSGCYKASETSYFRCRSSFVNTRTPGRLRDFIDMAKSPSETPYPRFSRDCTSAVPVTPGLIMLGGRLAGVVDASSMTLVGVTDSIGTVSGFGSVFEASLVVEYVYVAIWSAETMGVSMRRAIIVSAGCTPHITSPR